MAYKALYRKYRPNTFEEVVGQQNVVATLLNAIKNDKLAHAYLFCGPRGTGKTSIAKLLAKTINCTNDGFKPCGKCSNCIDITNGSNPDVIEMDAATNNGVDEVREIIDKVKYAPMNGKYKVYIIDEVHMMTSSAFNALLKTLEEPPSYCIFILATTEPQKVLPTIISRCQRFDFKKIPVNVIEGKLRQICEKEYVVIDDEALRLIAELAEGGMRDALSILDQCIAYSQTNITAKDVSAVYGVASLNEKLDLLSDVNNLDSKKIVEKVNDISSRGLDIQKLITDLINILKETVIYDYSHSADILSILNIKQAQNLLKNYTTSKMLEFVDCLIETQTRIKNSTNAITYFEVCMLKMMNLVSLKKEEITNFSNVNNEQKVYVEEQLFEINKPKEINVITNDFNPTNVPKIIEYSDQEYFEILVQATKNIKFEDATALSKLTTIGLDGELLEAIENIKNAEIMASSKENMIFVVEERKTANLINNINIKRKVEEILSTYLQNKKEIIAVTVDQKEFLINYFKAHRDNKREEKKVEIVSVVDDSEARMSQLFGKDGFDIVR